MQDLKRKAAVPDLIALCGPRKLSDYVSRILRLLKIAATSELPDRKYELDIGVCVYGHGGMIERRKTGDSDLSVEDSTEQIL